MKQYEERVVVFLDILGFKNMVSETIDDNIKYEQVTKALTYISEVRKENYHGLFSQYDFSGKEVSVFSDSIVLSYPKETAGSLFYILIDLVYICLELNVKGIFVRGGVTYGKLYHKDHICFGPAMIKAYELEQKHAIYPRIIVDEIAIVKGIEFHGSANTPKQEAEYISNLLEKFDDNLFFLDYLSQWTEVDEPEYFECVLRQIKPFIEKNLRETREDSHVYEKYKWFTKYFNTTVEKLYSNNKEIFNDLIINNTDEVYI
jgi:hypothetical protein